MDEFFMRFSLQQSAGVLDENEFELCSRVGANSDEMKCFCEKCTDMQKAQAEILKNKYKDIDSIKGKSIVFIGDSITADRFGYRGIVTKAAELHAESIAFSGATSCDMHRYLFEKSISADIASIMIGTNDSTLMENENQIVSISEYRRNISNILEECKKRYDITVIMTIPPIHEEGCSKTYTNSNKNIDIYCNIVREEAKRYGAILVDINSEIKKYDENEMFIKDGVHLSYEGQCVLSDLWLKTILK